MPTPPSSASVGGSSSQVSNQGDAWRWPAGVDQTASDGRVPPVAGTYSTSKGRGTPWSVSDPHAAGNAGRNASAANEAEAVKPVPRKYLQIVGAVSALLFLILLLSIYHFLNNQNVAEDHFLAAQKAFKQEIYDKAGKEIAEAIRLAPFANTEYKEFQKEIEEKQQQAEAFLRKRAEARAHADKANDFGTKNQWDEAQQEIAKALELAPGNEEFLKLKERIENSAYFYKLKKQAENEEGTAVSASGKEEKASELPISAKPDVEESLAEIDPTIKDRLAKKAEESKPEGGKAEEGKPSESKPGEDAQAKAEGEPAAAPETPPAPPVVQHFKEAPSDHKAGEEFKRMLHGVSYRFRWCPPGTFMMGSPENEPGRDIGERERQHLVTLTQGFWLLETEVTQQMWEDIMKENPSKNKGPQNPVENVSWNECQKFCVELSQAADFSAFLPTESQWEYACRAGTETPFAVDCNEAAWYRNNSDGQTHEVAKKQPNAWGLYDMHGNVCEWCDSWFENYPTQPVKDPKGFPTSTSTNKVRRGGTYSSSDSGCRSASRQFGGMGQKQATVGFRIIAVPK